jgi:hypothetical protein
MRKSPEGPLATLADEIRAGLDIRAICLDCQHTSILTSAALAQRLGPNFVVRRLVGRLRCHKCRSKQVDIIVLQPNAAGPVAGHGPSRSS